MKVRVKNKWYDIDQLNAQNTMALYDDQTWFYIENNELYVDHAYMEPGEDDYSVETYCIGIIEEIK